MYREDDKGTKAVLRFADPVKDSDRDLIHALFFARWCNRESTLNALHPSVLKTPSKLSQALLHEVHQPWASEVYPVVPACWEGREHSRLDACVEMFPHCMSFLDLLQQHLKCASHQEAAARMIELQGTYWPQARRKFTPIDIEYLSCECRKYFSYLNGTKKFEGKNVFVPSEAG